MDTASRWPARVALVISILMFGAVMGAFDAFGMPVGISPMAQATSASPSASASASPSASSTPCRFSPAPAPICPSSSPPASSSASPTPSGSPTTGEETEAHDSTITIDFTGKAFSGAVKSVAKCEKQRKVLVRKVRKGPDKLIGKDTTNRSGKYLVESPDTRRGKYYAKVLKRVFTQGTTQVTCRGAKSKIEAIG